MIYDDFSGRETWQMDMNYEWPEGYGSPEWFIQDRYGLFIHFGLFSAAARHEWVMTLE